MHGQGMPDIKSHRAAQGSGIKVQTGAREMRGHRHEKRTSRKAEKQSSGPRKKGGCKCTKKRILDLLAM